ncbi:MAG: MoxR family ATPase [Candidatus Poribacteria bacterium]|nr:MoxR family ATPase [Candidatus Poribacteria bacterium]MDE0504627.1 MoxR family ATPase [Candidatus Poribacteria bacterium]
MFESIEEVQSACAKGEYITDRALATTLYLAHNLNKPIFLEGEPGVGKTEVAKVLATITDGKLIRLQCYEGLDAYSALYEWNYAKQILQLRIDEAQRIEKDQIGANLFSEDFLLKRPLLDAIQSDGDVAPVLLIDEVDRSDSEFEAFLLEILSDFQITIPEIGTIRAKHIPYVVLTSNRTREVHEALKRRCLYQWIDYPSLQKELSIVKTKIPNIDHRLAQQLCSMMQIWREGDYYKKPGIAETLDWGLALIALGKDTLDPEIVDETLGCLFKYQDDVQRAQGADLHEFVARAKRLADSSSHGEPEKTEWVYSQG